MPNDDPRMGMQAAGPPDPLAADAPPAPDTPPAGSGTQSPNAAAAGPAPGAEAMATLLGQIVWLYGRSAAHRHLVLADLDWLVMPPLALRQMRLWRKASDQAGGQPLPVVYAAWAFVSPEIGRRLAGGQARLAPADWKSGEEAWLVDVVAPFGGADAAIAELARAQLGGRTVKMLVPAAGGGFAVREVGVPAGEVGAAAAAPGEAAAG